jgi:transcriptional regulator with XRE-family HTH domain
MSEVKKETMTRRVRHSVLYGYVMSGSSQPSNIFPTRLRQARELRDLNQGDLADRAGMQASAISHFETGNRKPSFDNLRRLADALDVTTDYLLGRVSDVGATAAADRLHRDIQKLKATDRSFAEDMIQRMVARAKVKAGNGG